VLEKKLAMSLKTALILLPSRRRRHLRPVVCSLLIVLPIILPSSIVLNNLKLLPVVSGFDISAHASLASISAVVDRRTSRTTGTFTMKKPCRSLLRADITRDHDSTGVVTSWTTAAAKSSCSDDTTAGSASTKKKNRKLYSFGEARKVARGHGFSSREEFVEYECPGAYQLPKDPDVVWSEEWIDWDDWLGIPWEFRKGREIARKLNLKSESEYLQRFQKRGKKSSAPADDTSNYHPDEDRLPYRPDLYYKNDGWNGWEDWLGN